MGLFWYRGPLPPESPLFRGRTTELNRLTRMCRADVESYAIIFGGRQTGKTSLLYRLSSVLAETRTPVGHVDFQFLSDATTPRAIAYLAQHIAETMPGAVVAPDVVDQPGLVRFLCECISQSQVRNYVLLIEEIGALPQRVREDMANLLRAIFNSRFRPPYLPLGRLMVIIAGGVELYELAAIRVSPLINVCEPIYLADLAETEATNLVVENCIQAGIAPQDATALAQTIYEHVQGHPYLTQRIGGFLDAAWEQGEQPAPTHIPHLADQLLHRDDPLLEHIRRTVREHALLPACQILLQGTVSFSRMHDPMARLELAGVATERHGFWAVRNALLHRAISLWTETDTQEQSQFARYEAGLHTLLERLGSNHPRYGEALTYEQRLRENIQQAAQYGDSRDYESGRAAIIMQLNTLARATLGLSFNELCT